MKFVPQNLVMEGNIFFLRYCFSLFLIDFPSVFCSDSLLRIFWKPCICIWCRTLCHTLNMKKYSTHRKNCRTEKKRIKHQNDDVPNSLPITPHCYSIMLHPARLCSILNFHKMNITMFFGVFCFFFGLALYIMHCM